jgi:hypothetical protein
VLQAGFPKSLGAFFPGSTGDVGDPRAFYDWNAGRFVVLADDFSGGNFYLAASATSDPRSTWHVYTINAWGAANCRRAGSACADFPTLGFDQKPLTGTDTATIYIGLNLFPAGGGRDAFMLFIPKTKAYAGVGISITGWHLLSFGGVMQDTLQPVSLLGGAEQPRAGFAVNTHNNFANGQCRTPCNGIVVWAFSNNLPATGSPGAELSAVLVPTANNITLPANANEPGCAGCIDTNDPRISGTPYYHNGIISAALNNHGAVGPAHVLWFQIHPTLNDNDSRCTGSFLNLCPQITTAALLNEDCFFCGGQGTAGSSFYGTLAPDDAGNVTMVFGYSDNITNPESAYVSRRVTQAQNTMHDSGFVLCGGATPFLQGHPARWGDYTGAAGDIASGSVNYQWFSAQNVIPGGNWGTCVGRNGFGAENQP